MRFPTLLYYIAIGNITVYIVSNRKWHSIGKPILISCVTKSRLQLDPPNSSLPLSEKDSSPLLRCSSNPVFGNYCSQLILLKNLQQKRTFTYSRCFAESVISSKALQNKRYDICLHMFLSLLSLYCRVCHILLNLSNYWYAHIVVNSYNFPG